MCGAVLLAGMSAQFSEIVCAAQNSIQQTLKSKALRDEALFEIARYISELNIGAQVKLIDGRSAMEASPADIFAMTFMGHGLKASA